MRNIDIEKKKWNIKIFGMDEAVVNIHQQISGLVVHFCEYHEKRGCMTCNIYIFYFFIWLFYKFKYR